MPNAGGARDGIKMSLGLHVPQTRRPIRRALARLLLRALGWKLDVTLPDVPKMVVIAAPHTSNWDGWYAVLTIFALDLRIALFAKHTLFRWPFGPLARWMNFLPVDRRAAGGMVAQTQAAFAQRKQLVVGIAAEGTRQRVEQWKSGFWQIARAAQVPLVCAYLDYGRKVVGIGPVFMPSEDYAQDLARIQAFYRTITPHTPENFALPPG